MSSLEIHDGGSGMSRQFSLFNDHFVMVSYLLITTPLTYAVALTKYHIITSLTF